MRTNCSPHSKKRGLGQAFTLMEVAIAVAIVAISMTGVFGVMTMGLSISESSRENLRATQIMLDKMEGVRLYSWNQITNSSFLASTFTNWYFETNNVGLSTAQGYGIRYTGNIAVSPMTGDIAATSYGFSMRQVTVTVNWNSAGCGWGSGTLAHTRTMTTYVAEQGIQNYVYYSP